MHTPATPDARLRQAMVRTAQKLMEASITLDDVQPPLREARDIATQAFKTHAEKGGDPADELAQLEDTEGLSAVAHDVAARLNEVDYPTVDGETRTALGILETARQAIQEKYGEDIWQQVIRDPEGNFAPEVLVVAEASKQLNASRTAIKAQMVATQRAAFEFPRYPTRPEVSKPGQGRYLVGQIPDPESAAQVSTMLIKTAKSLGVASKALQDGGQVGPGKFLQGASAQGAVAVSPSEETKERPQPGGHQSPTRAAGTEAGR